MSRTAGERSLHARLYQYFRVFDSVGYVSRWGLLALNMQFQLKYFFYVFCLQSSYTNDV